MEVYIEERAYFDCPNCGQESRTEPSQMTGSEVVCGYCGATHEVGECGYMVVDWNERNKVAAATRQQDKLKKPYE